VDGDENEIGGSGEILRCGLGDLGGGGEMDEAVARVGFAAGKSAAGFGRPPRGPSADFVDRRHRVCLLAQFRRTDRYFTARPRESGDPANIYWEAGTLLFWIPACAGMSGKRVITTSRSECTLAWRA